MAIADAGGGVPLPTAAPLRSAGLWPRLQAFALDYLRIAAYLLLLAGLSLFLLASPWRQAVRQLFAQPVSSELTQLVLLTLPVVLYFGLANAPPARAPGASRGWA